MRILLEYKAMPVVFFGDSHEFPYELTLEETYLFGLRKRTKKVTYTVSMFQSIREHTDHWDNLIETKGEVK